MPEPERDPLLEEADRLRGDRPDPGPDPTTAVVLPPPPPPPPTRTFDPGALLVGIWFMIAGVVAAVLSDSALEDLPPLIVPISFAVVGLGLLLPKRTLPRSGAS